MKRERKIYDPAFKRKAVELSNYISNIVKISRELGIQVSMFYIYSGKWVGSLSNSGYAQKKVR